MPLLPTAHGSLHYEVCDVVPAWRTPSQTVLFHHGIAADVNLWADWIPVLAPHYRLVRFDMRGFGRSTVPGDDYPWSFDGLVDDLLSVADSVGAERFHLVGESIGGTAAIACALHTPGRVASLCLSNSAARGGLVANVTGWAEEVRLWGQHGWAERMMARRFHAGALDPALHEWYRELHATCSMSAVLGLAQLLLSSDLTPRLGAIAAPTLLLSPDGSPFIPAQVMAAMQAAIPGAELQVFAHSRHGLPLSHGAACAKALRGFLERLPAANGADA